MQSHYIYAVLSNNIYNDPQTMQPLPDNWKELPFPTPTASDVNFHAATYINVPLKKIIIVFRGTVTVENKIREDLFEIAMDNAPHLFTSNVLPFVDAVTAKASREYPDFEISFTGHSLGAILAELCVAKYMKLAITFESPGSGKMIIDMANKNQLPLDTMAIIKRNIFSYQAAISLINRKNSYFGTRIRLYPSFDSSAPTSIPPLASNCGTLDIPTPGIFWEYSYQQHRMKSLLDQFDPVEGAMVYSEYPFSEESGFLFSFNTWINYDKNPYYWDQVIGNFYFPLCGNGQSLENYKESYINRRLLRNINPNQQVGVTIHSPGSASYPNLIIWGTTQGKDILLFGKGKFKVIAYGFNTYKLTRDAQVSCEVEQMTLDSNRDSRLFIGDQMMQGYALYYNTASAFQHTLYLSNDLKVSWSRVPSDTKETYSISIGNNSAGLNPEFSADFPVVRFTNSPPGQFNILAGEAYQYDGLGWLAASSKGVLYNVTYSSEYADPEKLQDSSYNIYQQTLAGEVIDVDKMLFMHYMSQCDKDASLSPMQMYEKEGMLHLFFWASCDQDLNIIDNQDEFEYMASHNTCVDIMDNSDVIFSCYRIDKFSYQFDNFEGSFQCDDSNTLVPLMPLMQYSLQSGYKLITTNPTLIPDKEMAIVIKKSDISILDEDNNQLFNLLSPLSSDDDNSYFPGAVLFNDNILIVGFNLGGRGFYEALIYRAGLFPEINDIPINRSSYAIYWETSSLAYFKSVETAPLLVEPMAAFVEAPILQQTDPADLLKVLGILFAINMMRIGIKNFLRYKENKTDGQQPLLNPQNTRQDYHTFSESMPPVSLPSQKNQKSPFIALSIYKNKIKSNQADILENNRSRKERCCAVM